MEDGGGGRHGGGHTRTRAGGEERRRGRTSLSHDNCDLCYESRVAKSLAAGMTYTPFFFFFAHTHFSSSDAAHTGEYSYY